MTGIELREVGPDRVAVSGARARPRTATHKVSIGYFDGYLGEGQLSYGGQGAVARARLAGEVVTERLRLRGFAFDALDTGLIGLDSLHGPGEGRPEPYEVRLRVTGRTQDRKAAEAVGFEVAALYTNGPAGGAGDAASVREILAVQSVLLPRDLVQRPRRGGGRRAMLRVRDLAHARAGDKGHSVNISVIAWDEAGYERLRRELTEDRVAAAFASLAEGPVRRYALPALHGVQLRHRAGARRRRDRDRRARHPRQEPLRPHARHPAAGQRARIVERQADPEISQGPWSAKHAMPYAALRWDLRDVYCSEATQSLAVHPGSHSSYTEHTS